MEDPPTSSPFSENLRRRESENDLEMVLLDRDPGALVTRYQEMFRIIAMYFVATGMFRVKEVDDVVQSISLEILTKIPLIRQKYNGSTLLRTYVSTIVRNFCIRQKLIERGISPDQEIEVDMISADVRTDHHLLLKEAIARLRTVFAMFDAHLPKLLLALKIYYKMPIAREEMEAWFPGSTPALREEFVRLFQGQENPTDRTNIYEVVLPLINELEGKTNTRDAFRRWSWAKIDEVVRLMNGPSKTFNFDRDSLRELVEDYFSPFLTKE
jgi:hypothetical protein